MRADRILDIKGSEHVWVNFYVHIHATVPEYAGGTSRKANGTSRMDIMTKILLEEYDAELHVSELWRDEITIEFPTEAIKTLFLLKYS